MPILCDVYKVEGAEATRVICEGLMRDGWKFEVTIARLNERWHQGSSFYVLVPASPRDGTLGKWAGNTGAGVFFNTKAVGSEYREWAGVRDWPTEG